MEKWRNTFTVGKNEKTKNKLCGPWTSHNFSDLGQKNALLFFFFPASNLLKQIPLLLNQK